MYLDDNGFGMMSSETNTKWWSFHLDSDQQIDGWIISAIELHEDVASMDNILMVHLRRRSFAMLSCVVLTKDRRNWVTISRYPSKPPYRVTDWWLSPLNWCLHHGRREVVSPSSIVTGMMRVLLWKFPSSPYHYCARKHILDTQFIKFNIVLNY